MYKIIGSIIVVSPMLGACGGAAPPVQRLADAQAAERSARELGAEKEPSAQLSLKLAQDQIALAQKAVSEGENEKAESLLVRAKADAELAIAKAREKAAKTEVQKAAEESAAQKATNVGQGAAK